MSEFISPANQAMNLIRYIGNEVSKLGIPIKRMSGFAEHIGAQNEIFANQLAEELLNNGIIKTSMKPAQSGGGYILFFGVNLTLEGWTQYEAIKRGRASGSQGFIAMKFNDPELDSFVNEVVKPATREIGYDLVDMRDVARAGVIDNIMRAQIEDAAFVIADLTHDNLGAYWEAGYAEGLGKPVVYICERTKFKDTSTHFDTNHCTTVPWSSDDPDGFHRELIATLRRSLDLN